MNAATFGVVFATEFIDGAEAFVTPFARFLCGGEQYFGRSLESRLPRLVCHMAKPLCSGLPLRFQ